MMKNLSLKELKVELEKRTGDHLLPLREIFVENADLSGWNMDHVDFSLSTFRNVCFDGASLKGSSIENSLFDQCTFRGTCFENADMRGAAMRYDDLSGADIRGANLFSAVLEHADLTGIVSDENTKFFRLYCPEKGAFLGYKKCFNNRLVQLLIPADAKRTSATLNSCRCNKAKVLTIKSFDYSEEYDEAWSLVDENFVYRRGQWVEVKNFDEDRWNDSTTGIHFWLTREEAKAY